MSCGVRLAALGWVFLARVALGTGDRYSTDKDIAKLKEQLLYDTDTPFNRARKTHRQLATQANHEQPPD